MPNYYKPHSSQWFEALMRSNPPQAAHTATLIRQAGREDICSVCGDAPSQEYQILKQEFAPGVVASIRLCPDCLRIRAAMHGESFVPLSAGSADAN